MTNPPDLSEPYNELLNELRDFEQKLRAVDPPLPEPDLVDGYRLGFSLLRVAVDAYVWGDKIDPILSDVIGPYLKWGGDNSDAFYQCVPVDPARTYRVTGNRGDAVYLSMTVYGGPDDGRYSDRIVATLNDRELTFDETGDFAFTMSPDPPTWHPEIDPGYYADGADLDAMIAGYRTVCDVAGQGPLAEYIAEPWDPASSNPSTDDIVAFIARRGQTVYHPVGTCAMGTAKNSVVDPQLKVHGVEGLRVADASVMPRATRGNTNAPTIMIGEKCADLIKESR